MWLAQEWYSSSKKKNQNKTGGQTHGHGERGERLLTQVYLLFNKAEVFIFQLHNLLCRLAAKRAQHGDWCPYSISRGSQLPVCGSPRLEFHAGIGKFCYSGNELRDNSLKWLHSYFKPRPKVLWDIFWSTIVDSCAPTVLILNTAMKMSVCTDNWGFWPIKKAKLLSNALKYQRE